MIDQKNFSTMAKWVRERIPDEPTQAVSDEELRQTLTALTAVAEEANATFLIPDLFPGIQLDVLYVASGDAVEATKAVENQGRSLVGGLSSKALTAIGQAVTHELSSIGCDMVTYKADGAEIIVFKPEVRPLVLQATGTTLLTRQ